MERFLEKRGRRHAALLRLEPSGDRAVLDEAFADADAPTAHWNAARAGSTRWTARAGAELHGLTAEIARCAVDAIYARCERV